MKQTFEHFSPKTIPRETTPRVEEIDTGAVSFLDIAQYYSRRPHFVFLDSRLRHQRDGRYSFIAFAPYAVFRAWQGEPGANRITLTTRTPSGERREERIVSNIFVALEEFMSAVGVRFGPGRGDWPPFLGGGIGYFAYELARQEEVLPPPPRDVMGIPACYTCFYNIVLCRDHEAGKTYLAHFDVPGLPPGSGFDAGAVVERLKGELREIPAGCYGVDDLVPGEKILVPGEKIGEILVPGEKIRADFTRGDYMAAVNRIKEYILSGDVYQADLTQRFEVDVPVGGSWELYKRLMDINPSHFAAYLNFDGVAVVSSSPERFLRIRGDRVETRPIKGTVRRGATPGEDQKNKDFLYHDEKNRAELAMIVDLLRNDLGRVCRAGSVRVGPFPELETYASLHHLACTISGRLRVGVGVTGVLRAAFPGGSITGAPKIRAMEILSELEPVQRGVYTGSIGYLGFNGHHDLNIAIRTITVTGGRAHIQAGGGIVADSDAAAEYDETLLKAQKLFGAV